MQLCQKICLILPYWWFILVDKRLLQMFDAMLSSVQTRTHTRTCENVKVIVLLCLGVMHQT